jgi:hypothetical protein
MLLKADPVLLSAVRPKADESLCSLISAAADINRLKKVRPLLSLIDGPYSLNDLHGRYDLAPRLAKLISVDITEITSRMYGVRESSAAIGTLNYFGTEVPTSWITTSRRVAAYDFLPKNQNGSSRPFFHKAVWDIALFDVCPDSGSPLVGRCLNSNCGKQLTWILSDVFVCQACGQKIAKPENSDNATRLDMHLQGTQFVADLLCPWRDSRAKILETLPKELQHLRPVEVVALVLELPSLNLEFLQLRGNSGSRAHHRSPADLKKALAMVDSWPHGIYSEIDRLVAEKPGIGRASVTGRLGLKFAEFIRKLDRMSATNDPIYSRPMIVLLETIARYFAGRIDFPVRPNGVLGAFINSKVDIKKIKDQDLFTQHEASKALKLSHKRIRSLVRDYPDLLASGDRAGSGATMLVRRSVLERIIRDESNVISRKECMKILNFSKEACSVAIARGLIPLVTDGKIKQYGNSKIIAPISRSGVEELRDIMHRRALKIQKNKIEARFVTMTGAAVAFRGFKLDHPIVAMLKGEISYYHNFASSRSGSQFCFDPVELHEYLLKFRKSKFLSNLEMAKILGFSQRTLMALSLAGIVKPIPERGSRNAWLYPIDQLRLVAQKIITTSQTKAALKLNKTISTRNLAHLIRDLGVKPVVGPGSKFPSGNAVWRLSDLRPHRELLVKEIAKQRRRLGSKLN